MRRWKGTEILWRAAISSPRRRLCSQTACCKLFVGGLSYDTNEVALRDAFSPHGKIIEVKVICHPTSAKSKGYGFIKFSSESEAAAALKIMDGQFLDGRNLRVSHANNG